MVELMSFKSGCVSDLPHILSNCLHGYDKAGINISYLLHRKFFHHPWLASLQGYEGGGGVQPGIGEGGQNCEESQ